MSLNTRYTLCILLCALQQVAGQLQGPPQNVTFYSKNFTVFLKWLPGLGYPPDVQYTVKYRFSTANKTWKTIPHCENISRRECNVTCVDQYYKYKARVRASSITYKSPWKESETYFRYTDDVELGPAQLQVKEAETEMTINAFVQLPSCLKEFFLGLKYDLIFWEDGKEFKIHQTNRLLNEAVIIPTAHLSGNYCMTARTTFALTDHKRSPFSEPVCMLLSHSKKNDWHVPVGISMLLLLIFGVPVVVILLKEFKKLTGAKMPASLDFSAHRSPVVPLVGDPQEVCSVLCRSDLHLRDMKDQYHSPLDDDEESISSCGGYTDNHQFHQTDAPNEDSNETHPYKQLSSTNGTETGSSDHLEHSGSSHLLFGDNSNEEDVCCPYNKDTSISELCGERDLPPNYFKIEDRNPIGTCALRVNVPNLCQTPLEIPFFNYSDGIDWDMLLSEVEDSNQSILFNEPFEDLIKELNSCDTIQEQNCKLEKFKSTYISRE